MDPIQFTQDNWAAISTILFLLSEVLASIPGVKANSVFQVFASLVKRKELPIVLLALSISACSSGPEKVQANVNKIRAVAVKVRAGLQQVEIYGCAGAEVLTAAYPEVKDLIPPGSDADEIGRIVAVAEPVIEQICTKAQMQRR